MWTDEQFEQLEQEEMEYILESLAIMYLTLDSTRYDLEKELRNFYQKYGTDGVVTYHEARKWVSEKDHTHRLTALLLLVSDSFASTMSKLNKEFGVMINGITIKEMGLFDVKLDKLPNFKWGADKLDWSVRLSDNGTLWLHRISADLKRAMHRGQSLDDVLNLVNKRFDSIEKTLKRLSITESTAVGSIVRKEIFSELGIKKYQYFTKVDERRCEECGALHGKIFPISAFEVGVTASPIHGHCRCWEVPIWD